MNLIQVLASLFPLLQRLIAHADDFEHLFELLQQFITAATAIYEDIVQGGDGAVVRIRSNVHPEVAAILAEFRSQAMEHGAAQVGRGGIWNAVKFFFENPEALKLLIDVLKMFGVPLKPT